MHLGVWSWTSQSPELQTGCHNGKERWFKQFWAWHGCWCQTGRFEYFHLKQGDIWPLYALKTGGSRRGRQHAQCIMGVEVSKPIWQTGRQQPYFSVFSSLVAPITKNVSLFYCIVRQVLLKAHFVSGKL